MERIRSDNDRSPHPPENPAVPLIQADPSLLAPNGRESDVEDTTWPSPPPSTTDVQYDDKPPPRSQPLFRGFEKPNFSRIVILTVLCLAAYPAFYLLTLVARARSLFIVRLLVSTWCSVVGFVLGYVLLKIGAQHLEAASKFNGLASKPSKALSQTAWATVIHMSREGSGMKLRDLKRGSGNPTSFMPAFHILRSRFRNKDTARRSRKSYESVPKSSSALHLLTLLQQATMVPVLRILRHPRYSGSHVTFHIRSHHGDRNFRPRACHRLAASLCFLSIEQNQRKAYHEVLIAGDLSEADISQAGAIGYLLLSDKTASDTVEFPYESETVYFAEPSPSQFVSGGSGSGTFDPPPKMGLKDTQNNTPVFTGRSVPRSNAGAVLRYASPVCWRINSMSYIRLIRYSQWGIRIHCERLPNPEVNLCGNLTRLHLNRLADLFITRVFTSRQSPTFGLALVPRNFLQGLFGVYGVDLPTELMNLELSDQDANDPTLSTALSNIDPSTISYFGEFLLAPCILRTYHTHYSEIIEYRQRLLPRLQHTIYDW